MSVTSSIIIVTLLAVIVVETVLLFAEDDSKRCTVPVPANHTVAAADNSPEGDAAASTSTSARTTRTFSYPYPLTWTQNQNDVHFSLTGVTVGDVRVPDRFFQAQEPAYPIDSAAGETIHAVVFHIKAKNTNKTVALDTNLMMRRLRNEEGDMYAPNTMQHDPPLKTIEPNTTYSDQRVIFAVPEDEEEFTFTTGGPSDIYFTVARNSDGVTLETVPDEG